MLGKILTIQQLNKSAKNKALTLLNEIHKKGFENYEDKIKRLLQLKQKYHKLIFTRINF